MKLLPLLLALTLPATAADILMVADEIPAMEVLSKQLKTRIGATTEITTQDKLPATLSNYPVLMVYIHRDIIPAAEHAFIDYATGGGNLILLHHSISSGKRKNKDWFNFLNIELPDKPYAEGGYKYFDPADFSIENLATAHYITTHNVQYPETSNGHPAFSYSGSEVYINHVYTGPRTTLLGISYKEKQQPSAAWLRPAGKGTVMYFMAGHRAEDFDNSTYAQILANAVTYATSSNRSSL